ncbi:MAG TPA: PilW family protein [Burkholderiales bacterium]|nr:PilW family protein [Burkholderiales bacterium]
MRLSRQSGFSLIEILVGVAIGLIGMVVVFQSLQIWESRKRTTASGSDAQVSGTVALFNIERDLRQGGYGFGNSTYMGCTVNAYDTTRGAAFTFPLVPVYIVDGGATGPDEIRSLHGNSAYFTSSETFDTSTSTSKRPHLGINSFRVNDLVVVAGNAFPSGNCSMVEVDSVGAQDITHSGGLRYNNPAGTGTTFSSGNLYNLGPGPQRIIWQVRSGNVLSWRDDISDATGTAWNDVAEGIVDLQAEYGIDTNGDSMIASTEWTSTAPSTANWKNVRAIRIGILARSQQYEQTPPAGVTQSVPTWSGSTSSPFVVKNLDGTAGTTTPANPVDSWKHYRYRVYEQVIPLRNVIWGYAP